MKLTGERPIEGATPDSLLALHEAGYREVAERLGEGQLVVDLGAGLGDGTARLAGAGRGLIGVDYDPETAILAAKGHPDLLFACGDGARIPLRDGVAGAVCSSHLIEHFEAPEAHVREIGRVLSPGGRAIFLTPNAPADFENPYHVSLFEPPELGALLERHFGSVLVFGLDAVPAVKADFERRRRLARRVLALDVFGLRHRVPRQWFVSMHTLGRRVAYRVLSGSQGRGNSGITADDFFVTKEIDESTLVLLAIAEQPL